MIVAAVIVTYNRLALLRRCLSGVASQTRTADLVIVVDNASTDGTAEWLSENTAQTRRVLTVPVNEGAARGFAEALAYVREQKIELAWVMDDDGIPSPNALDELLRVYSKMNGPVILNSAVVADTSADELAFGVWINDETGRNIRRIDTLKELVMTSDSLGVFWGYGCFYNGTLIPLVAIEAIGLPDARLYIRGDEVDYFYRARRQFQIGTCARSIHLHPKGDPKISGVKLYYAYRNARLNQKKHLCVGKWGRMIVNVKLLAGTMYFTLKAAWSADGKNERILALASRDALVGDYSRTEAEINRLAI